MSKGFRFLIHYDPKENWFAGKMVFKNGSTEGVYAENQHDLIRSIQKKLKEISKFY